MTMAGVPKIGPFKSHTMDYEDWFEKYPWVYAAELKALRSFMPERSGNFLEVGVGSGRFAKDLGINTGIDPCPEMLALARERGVRAVLGVAEFMPFVSGGFDLAAMITVLCFLNDPAAALTETGRILKRGGLLLLAFIDRHSPLGSLYRQHQADSLFYREARFYGVDEVAGLMAKAGFVGLHFISAIGRPLAEVDRDEPILSATGQGAFVVACGVKR